MRKTRKHQTSNPLRDRDRRVKRGCLAFAVVILAAILLSPAAFASGGDPLQTINNFSDFIFTAIKAVGLILLGFGIVQIGLSLKGHDPSQRAQGFLSLFGGILIFFAKEILDLITG